MFNHLPYEKLSTLIDYIKNIVIFYQNNLLLLGFICCIFIILFQSMFLIKYRHNSIHKVFDTENINSEWCILNSKFELINSSEKFFLLLNLNKSNIFESIKKLDPDLYNLMITAIKNKKSFTYLLKNKGLIFTMNYAIDSIKIHLFLSNDYLFDLLPIPINIEIDQWSKCNKNYSLLNNYQAIKIPINGEFVLKNGIIYRKEIFQTGHHKITIFCPCFKDADLQVLTKPVENKTEFPPFPICVLNKNNQVVKINNEFLQFFRLKNTPKDFIEIIDNCRGIIIPETINFREFKHNLCNKITSIDSEFNYTFLSLEGKMISLQFTSVDNLIYLIVLDVTNLIKNNQNQKYFINIKDNLLAIISDFLVVFNQEGEVVFSNCQLVHVKDNVNSARQVFKFLETPNNVVKEIKIDHEHKCLFLKNCLKEKIFQSRNNISIYLDKIVKVFNLLHTNANMPMTEYGRYTKFLSINIDNILKTLEISTYNNFEFSRFDIIEVFRNIKEKVDNVFTLKNIEFVFSEYAIMTKSHLESTELLFENLLLLAYKYQFNHKKFSIYTNNNKIIVSLDGIEQEEIDVIYSLLDILKNINVSSQIQKSIMNVNQNSEEICILFAFDVLG